ncbi:MAG TPA: glycosyltransferase [Bryobacteraceae bacterium]|jgi:glycosyltransferase involved in cell wall biosynthesis
MSADHPASGRDVIRILMTADSVGGVWQYSLDLISALSGQRFQCLLAALGPSPSDEQRRQAKSIPGLVLAEGRYALEWMTDAWADVDASGKWLLDLQATFDADVIHCNGFSHAVLRWGKPVVVVAHSCVRSWWRAVHGRTPGPEWEEYSRRVRDGLTACDRVIAPSNCMAEAIQGEYRIASKKISVIHNFTRSEPPDKNTKAPFILAAGRVWDCAKNLELLNRIAPRLEWEICIAGSTHGPDRSSVPFGNVTCLGALPRSELIVSMESAAIFAHPALYEPFGLSVLEAAKAGCCLVLSGIPSLRELWSDAAVFVNPRDPDAWIFELNRLARDRKGRERLASQAQARAGCYAAAAAVNQYVDLYRSLAGIEESKAKGAAA